MIFDKKTVLVIGGTGSLGKVFVKKSIIFISHKITPINLCNLWLPARGEARNRRQSANRLLFYDKTIIPLGSATTLPIIQAD